MTARERIETLTNGWYGFALVSGLATILRNGIGVLSLFWAAATTIFSIAFTWFIGRRLLARSGLTRSILVFLSAVSTVLGTLGAGRMVMSFFSDWSIGLLISIGLTVGSVLMNVRSFRVLTDDSVKSYCR